MDGISALMDGELETIEAEREIARLKSNDDLRVRWNEFHLLRDALHGDPLLSPGFSERFARRLAEEPTVLAPRRIVRPARRVTAFALSAAASVAAAALVAWVAVSPGNFDSGQLASTSTAAPTAARIETVAQQLPSVPSDGRMNEYLLAHEGFSPGTALQGLAPYIRTVSTIRQGNGR